MPNQIIRKWTLNSISLVFIFLMLANRQIVAKWLISPDRLTSQLLHYRIRNWKLSFCEWNWFELTVKDWCASVFDLCDLFQPRPLLNVRQECTATCSLRTLDFRRVCPWLVKERGKKLQLNSFCAILMSCNMPLVFSAMVFHSIPWYTKIKLKLHANKSCTKWYVKQHNMT